jgi:hypothetical protein
MENKRIFIIILHLKMEATETGAARKYPLSKNGVLSYFMPCLNV